MSLKTVSKYVKYLAVPTSWYVPGDANIVFPPEPVVNGCSLLVNITADRTCTLPSVAEIKASYISQTGKSLENGEVILKPFVLTSIGAFDYTLIAGAGMRILDTNVVQNQSAQLKFVLWDDNNMDVSVVV